MKLLAALAVTAAVLVSAPAMAASKTISFDGKCNTFTVRVQNKVLVAASENDVCGNIIGDGFVGTIQHQRTATIAFTESSLPGEQLNVSFDYPFVTGGTWVLYATADGKTMSALEQGTYTVGTAAGALPPPDKSLPPLGWKK